jgi:ankyrin repeat protein
MVRYDSPTLVQVFLDNGANLAMESSENAMAVHIAVGIGNLDTVKLLKTYGTNLTAQLNNKYGDTPLNIAAVRDRVAIAKYLIDNWVYIDVRNRKGATLLHAASRFGSIRCVELSLDAGAETNLSVSDVETGSQTLLHEAAVIGHVEIAKLSINGGAYLDARDFKKRTPLHMAAAKGRSETAKLLVERGADVLAKNNTGRTASELANSEGHMDLAKWLFVKEKSIVINTGDLQKRS